MNTTAPAPCPTVAAAALKDLKARYRRTKRWLDACDAYSAASAAGLPAEPPNVRQMPSKAHKHRMYASAGDLIRAADISHPRPMSMGDLGALIARFGG